MRVNMMIPGAGFFDFRQTVLSEWYEGENPVLKQYPVDSTEEYDVASFISDCEQDVECVISKLPEGSVHWFWEN